MSALLPGKIQRRPGARIGPGVPDCGNGIALLSGVITGFLARQSPRLPSRGSLAGLLRWTAAGALHLLAAAMVLVLPRAGVVVDPTEAARRASPLKPATIRLVFMAPVERSRSSGGGGGGNRQPGPIRRARGIGHDAVTLRAAPPVITSSRPTDSSLLQSAMPSLVLEARSLASGFFDQIGLPEGGVDTGASTGSGAGGGVGTGKGTGIGPGRGPGFGPGTGGGTGGGFYRPGGGVTAPQLVSRVNPSYTANALGANIQGSVWLEVVVNSEGRPTEIQVVRSLDPGLDQEAITAVRQWRFEPGRLSGRAVTVLVTIVLDFRIR
jgi:protein TonB